MNQKCTALGPYSRKSYDISYASDCNNKHKGCLRLGQRRMSTLNHYKMSVACLLDDWIPNDRVSGSPHPLVNEWEPLGRLQGGSFHYQIIK